MAKRSTLNFPGHDSDPTNHTRTEIRGDEEQLDERTPRSDYDPRWSSRFRKFIAMGTAAVAIAAGAVAYGMRGSDDAEITPQPRPTASAGLAPGEVVSEPAPTASEVGEPSQEVPVNMNDWDINTFEYDLEGKTYTGVAELEAAYGIKVAEYPEGQDAAKRFMEVANIWMNSLDTKADNTRYAGYDGKNQLVRNGGIAKDLAGPAWGVVLTSNETDPNGGRPFDPQVMVELFTGRNVQKIQDAAQLRADGENKDIYSGYTVNNLDVHTVYQGEVGFTAETTHEGPQGNQDVTMYITMKQVEGADGELYWKVISYKNN